MIKIEEAIDILKTLGMPKEQQNERSALTLLALLDLAPEKNWQDSTRNMHGVTPMMDFMRESWSKDYAPNTRETIRRQTLHQFVTGNICNENPDDPNRAKNSSKYCYQINKETYELIKCYGSHKWKKVLSEWQKDKNTLTEKYSRIREMKKIPITTRDGEALKLSPGFHSALIKSIIDEFSSRFAKKSSVIYVGDTGAKSDFFDDASFKKIGLDLDKKGKLPDVVLIDNEKKWLFLIESVTSHGPVDEKRFIELNELFKSSGYGLIFISAFPDRKTLNKFFPQIAWETEIWVAESPDHLIHLNGDKFIGPR